MRFRLNFGIYLIGAFEGKCHFNDLLPCNSPQFVIQAIVASLLYLTAYSVQAV